MTESAAEDAGGLFASTCSFLTTQQIFTLAEFLLNDADRLGAVLEQVPTQLAGQIRGNAVGEGEEREIKMKAKPKAKPKPKTKTKTSSEGLPETEGCGLGLPPLSKANVSIEKLLSVIHSL